MMLNFVPLIKYRDFRLLFLSQAISFLGNMVSYVVVPYQIYEITKSSFVVGLLGAVQLVPVLIFSLIGGSLADRINRRSLLIGAEITMLAASLGLVANSLLATPNVIAIFALVFVMQSASSYHRPAMEAMTQTMIASEDFPAVAVLGSLKYALTAIVGPALGGWLLFAVGTTGAFVFDAATFLVSLVAAILMSNSYIVSSTTDRAGFWQEMKQGLQFARGNQPLIGSYVVDTAAMTFAFPIALFPQIAAETGNKPLIGWIYAANAIGALLVAILIHDRNHKPRRRGKIISIAAATWGLGIALFGFSLPYLYPALFFLVVAGAADAISGLQRRVLWNEIIPNQIRGRLAGLELIGYMAGPLMGNFTAGTLAGFLGSASAAMTGGIFCIAAVAICSALLPIYWKYESPQSTSSSTQ